MFEGSGIVGYFDLSNCAPGYVTSVNLIGNCLNCTNEFQCKNLSAIGSNQFSQNCHNCHKKMSLTFSGSKLIKIRAPTVLTAEQIQRIEASKKKPKQKDPLLKGIVIGQPLPHEGTCKHYRKSKRW